MHNRQQFFQRQASILQMAESLLLDSADGDLTLDDLASSLEIAKGTLYKHFTSKDELYLHLLINYEKQLDQSVRFDDGAGAILARMVLFPLLNPRKAMFYHWLEERLSAYSVGQKHLFDELYKVRRERMNYLLSVAKTYLDELNSPMSYGDYLPTLWAVGQGGALLLNSSFYQRYLGSRERKILVWLQQSLSLPKLPQDLQGIVLQGFGLELGQAPSEEELAETDETNQADDENGDNAHTPPKSPIKHSTLDEFSPFGKLTPPVL